MANLVKPDYNSKRRVAAHPSLDISSAKGYSPGPLGLETRPSGSPIRKKWPSSPTKVKTPISIKALAKQAELELSVEEEKRKQANAQAASIGATLDPMTLEFDLDAPEKTKVALGKEEELKSSRRSAYDEYVRSLENQQGLIDTPIKPTEEVPNISKPDTKPEKTTPLDVCDGGAPIFPPVVFGAKELTPLSKIGRANREVQMWEEVVQSYKQNYPCLVQVGEERLQKAKDARAALDESLEENTRVGAVNPEETAIAHRISVLEWGLSTSKFGPESENIKCAIEGYKSGSIKFSTHYTVIYAAKIVDTAPDYSTFVHNRTERLDKYFATHGHGWMWYEPPLDIHPETRIRAEASVALIRDPSWNALAPYYINQGFWKRNGFVNRIPSIAHIGPATQDALFTRNEKGEVYCQDPAPPLAFRTLLDSGATFPSLHTEDLERLGIDCVNYGAQSLDQVTTASGNVMSRIYEMFVCVLDNNNKQLVNPTDAVWPYSFHFLGGLTPVIELSKPITIDSKGREQSTRLSGLLPFLACYISSTPTRSVLYLGEDRNDVLGHHRMPGQRKWAVDMKPIGQFDLQTDKYGDPKITFNHREGKIIDVDHPTDPHCSELKFNFPPTVYTERICPREQQESLRSNSRAPAPAIASPLIPGHDREGPFVGGGLGPSENPFSP